MNDIPHTFTDENQLGYVLNVIEDLDYEIARKLRRLSFEVEEFGFDCEAYEALNVLRELIGNFAAYCVVEAGEDK